MEALGEPWGRLGRSGDRPGGVLGARGAVLEAYKRHLGGSQRRLGAALGALEAMLEPSGGHKALKMEAKRDPIELQRRLELNIVNSSKTLVLF